MSHYYKKVAALFIQSLKENTAPWLKPWKVGEIPKIPYNALTGQTYNGINSFVLSLNQSGSSDSRWCTYKQAQSLGAQVKRGSLATQIQFWKFSDRKLKVDKNNKLSLEK